MSSLTVQGLDCPVAKDSLEIAEIEVGGRAQAFDGSEINQVRRVRQRISFDTPPLPVTQTNFWKAIFRPGAFSAFPLYEDLYSEQGHVPTIVGAPTFTTSGGPLADPASYIILAQGTPTDSISWEIVTGSEVPHYALLVWFGWTEPWELWGLSTVDDAVYTDGAYAGDVETNALPISTSFAGGVTTLTLTTSLSTTPCAGLVWIPGRISGANIVQPLTALGTAMSYWDLPRVQIAGDAVPAAGWYTGRVTGRRAFMISGVLYETLKVELTEV